MLSLGPGLQALAPQVGDVVRFGHAASGCFRFRHRFYNGFPYGRKIGAEEEFVDVQHDVRVLEVAIEAGLTAGTRAPEEVHVAIRFVSRHGTSLWTLWSTNTVQWMHLVRDEAFVLD